MLTKYIYPIDSELDIIPLISGVVSDSFIYKQASQLNNFSKFLYFLIFLIF